LHGALALRHDLGQDQCGAATVPRAALAARGPRGHGRGARDGGGAGPRPPDDPRPRLTRLHARAGEPGRSEARRDGAAPRPRAGHGPRRRHRPSRQPRRRAHRAGAGALMARLFGTDGIRGVANVEPLTTELAFRLGRQLVATLLEHHGLSKVRLVVGRDTRLSGPMIEGALVSGALSAGADVFTAGVLPTPGIAYLTRSLEAQGGIVLSASHNPFQDNGIKIFSSDGAKFPDAWEDEIEGKLAEADRAPKPTGAAVGRLVHYDRAEADYIARARQTFPFDLGGLSVALACAHGATYRVAPRLFRALGATAGVLAPP